MKVAMFTSKFSTPALYLASLVALVGWSLPADLLAVPITYTEQATTSGSLGGTAYTNALTTIMFTGDTANVTVAAPGLLVNPIFGTFTVTVGGIGTATFTDPMEAFVNQSLTIAGIANSSGGQVLVTVNSGFASYDLASSIGPLSGSSIIATGLVFGTTSGLFNIASSGDSTFTASTGASDYVVLNVGSTANFHGQILLSGGITDDHVLINMVGGNYTTNTGGPTLNVNTNYLVTNGIFLDPNGGMSLVSSTLDGRFWGGDATNLQIVSGANISAPVTVPEPASFLLLGSGLAALATWRRFTGKG